MHSSAFDESLLRICLNASAVEFSPLQTRAFWSASWPAAPRVPWPCPSHSPPTWWKFDSRPRWTWVAWLGATAAPCRPTNRYTSWRASAASGKVRHPLSHAAPLLNIKSTSIHFDPTISLTPPLPRRDSAQHHEKRAGELHRAGDVRPDQRGHPEAQPPVWWAPLLQYARTHPPTVIADWAGTNTPTQAFNSAAADKRAAVHEDIAHTGQLVHKLMIHLIHSVAFCSLRGEGGGCVTRLTRLTQRSSLI